MCIGYEISCYNYHSSYFLSQEQILYENEAKSWTFTFQDHAVKQKNKLPCWSQLLFYQRNKNTE